MIGHQCGLYLCTHYYATILLRRKPLEAACFGCCAVAAKDFMPRKVLVVGAGAAGLRVAVELAKRQADIVKVVLHAPCHPLDTSEISNCSIGAGGFWKPSFSKDPRVDEWALRTLDELWPMALDLENDLVELVPAVILHRMSIDPTMLPEWTKDSRLEFMSLTVEELHWQNDILRMRIPPVSELRDAGYGHCWLFQSPIVNTPKMLQYMLDELVLAGADVDVNTGRMYQSLDAMIQEAGDLHCDVVVNCTGLGSRQILGDGTLQGGRGVLHMYNRECCVRRREVDPNFSRDVVIRTADPPWAESDAMPCYLIPRANTIVIGGAYSLDDLDAQIRPEEASRLLRNADRLGIDTTKAKPLGEWIGFRPVRDKIRCEYDKEASDNKVRVVHCYGYGGSGWTINVGVAQDCAKLVMSS